MMAHASPEPRRHVRQRLSITGLVQGVGFRPYVWRRATRLGLAGWVENDAEGVTAEVQGPAARVQAFLEGLAVEAPPLARVRDVVCRDVPVVANEVFGFRILESAVAMRPTSAVPPDIATCAACLADVLDVHGRRHRYPFTNCTDCGPRFTIITGLPYDRPRTTMRGFTMCAACAAEYANPADRRFHAQPNACPNCGPAVWFSTAADPGGIASERPAATCSGDAAIERARASLLGGAVLAVKGLGGFHLVCDATSDTTVRRLRERKGRDGKPLAVLVSDLAEARARAEVDDQEARLLEGRERPIVLLRKRADGGGIAASVAPGNGFLGVMLPCLPLQHLLCAGMPPLVATSGNLAEEPIVRDNRAAAARLGPFVDGFLMHDRPIHVPCDDSVVRCVAGAALPIRRSRGHAPLPVRLAQPVGPVLAVGGELKAAICVARGGEAVMSQHIGDVGNLETLQALDHIADQFLRLFEVEPEVVACDRHPGYLSAGWARRFAERRGIPCVSVQHHEAHVASLVAEHGILEEPLIGVCFDGTGFGDDGTIQGGEFFVVRDLIFSRAAHLAPFPLPGGDASIRHPWRTALAMLHAAGLGWDGRLAPVQAAAAEGRRILAQQLDRGVNCVASTSMGRLFDAVAALAAVRQSISYEAEAALNLEALAAQATNPLEGYPLPLLAGATLQVDWRPLVEMVSRDAVAGCDAAGIAARFHRGVAAMITAVCSRLRETTGIGRVGLTGGVFQNALLVRLAVDALHAAGFDVLLHATVPPNDGGLALGQAVLATVGHASGVP
jgi:hydrogenase maturation protein HypF